MTRFNDISTNRLWQYHQTKLMKLAILASLSLRGVAESIYCVDLSLFVECIDCVLFISSVFIRFSKKKDIFSVRLFRIRSTFSSEFDWCFCISTLRPLGRRPPPIRRIDYQKPRTSVGFTQPVTFDIRFYDRRWYYVSFIYRRLTNRSIVVSLSNGGHVLRSI